MARKSRKKSQPTSTGPTSIAAVLEQSPVAQLVANHEAEPDDNQPEQDGEEAVAMYREQIRRELEAEPEREREQAQERERRAPEQRVPTSFADAVKASRSGFAPVAEGFVNVDSFPAAGIKVNRSLDKKVAALQFAEDRPLSRAAEYDRMTAIQDAGFSYKSARRQWERFDGENPEANLVDAKRTGAELAREREGHGR